MLIMRMGAVILVNREGHIFTRSLFTCAVVVDGEDPANVPLWYQSPVEAPCLEAVAFG